MDLLHLVDRLEELVASAQKMPIGNRAIIDRRRLLDIIDQMRIAVPQEMRDAQEIVAHRDALRREAEEDGRIIVAQAEEQASRLVQAHEITAAARRRAEEIAAESELRLEERIAEANADIQRRIQNSREIAREQMGAADDYARELLERLERQLKAFVSSVQAGIHQLQPEPPIPPRAATPRVSLPRREPERETHLEQARDQPREAVPYEEPDEPQHEEPESTPRLFGSGLEARSSIPLRRDEEPSEPQAHEQQPWAAPTQPAPQRVQQQEEELENLLRPRRRPTPRPSSLIDDFDHEPLDDDPMLTRLDDEEERR